MTRIPYVIDNVQHRLGDILNDLLREHLGNPALDRAEIRDLRKFLKQPLVGASVHSLRQALKTYTTTLDVVPLIVAIRELYAQACIGGEEPPPDRRGRPVVREDLHLVCYEYIWA